MNILDWFKPKNKRNVVIPTLDKGQLQGVELIKAFSTEDEPKVVDYPKSQYKLYWETFIDAIPGGYGALLRFYVFGGSGAVYKEHKFQAPTVAELRKLVSQMILDTMEQNKR